MTETLTSSPELSSEISWNLLLLGEETAKKWDHSEFNIEHIIHTLFSSSEFFAFIEKLSIDQDTVLDITEDFLEETPINCLLYTSPSPRDFQVSRMPSSA